MSRTLAALEKKHRELTERLRLVGKKERDKARHRLAERHRRLGGLVEAWLQEEPAAHDALWQRALAAKWPPSERSWLRSLLQKNAKEGL